MTRMMDVLYEARRALPRLLEDGVSSWNSMNITYEFPHVLRLWRQFDEEHRVSLHIIQPIPGSFTPGEHVWPNDPVPVPFRHKHPWKSGVMVMNGRYKMRLFRGDSVSEFVLSGGSSYAMEDPNDEHSVDPIDEVLSLMVTSKPFPVEITGPQKPVPKQPPLEYEQVVRVREAFRMLLYIRPDVGL